MFYNQNIYVPLSAAHNTDRWDVSTIGRLNAASQGEVWIEEIPYQYQTAQKIWRVVDAYYSPEDSIITYFRAYNEEQALPYAAFGVTWSSCPHQISGKFKYPPTTYKQYVPVENKFTTPNTGGYGVQVLDSDYPSERMHFGIVKDKGHKALVITFGLFPLGENYPNDG